MNKLALTMKDVFRDSEEWPGAEAFIVGGDNAIQNVRFYERTGMSSQDAATKALLELVNKAVTNDTQSQTRQLPVFREVL